MLTLTSTPLLDALIEYAERGIIRFHMPGHRGGQGGSPRLREWLGPALALDITGVLGLDDLHQAEGVLGQAQRLAARAFGADHSFFLVNGTSAGVHAMILTTCRPGDKIIVARNLHKSALAGLLLAGAHPVYVQPEIDPAFGMAMGVDPRRVAKTLAAHPDARAVMLASPTYYGITSDIAALAHLAHERGIPLLVDEAHGPHFRFHPELPEPALDAGADAAAQGIHKILSGLTQASMLHVRGNLIDVTRLKYVLQILQSTSPSYLLMASLDAARAQMVAYGRELWEEALYLARMLRHGVQALPGFRTFGRERAGDPGSHDVDLTKVTVNVTGLGISGPQAEHLLRYRYGIQAEMSDLGNLLFIVSYGNTHQDVQRLLSALRDMASMQDMSVEPSPTPPQPGAVPPTALPPLPPLPPLEVLPREAFSRPSHPVALEESLDRISAETVTCYPPGIPVVCPGERITAPLLDHLLQIRAAGLRLSGPADTSLDTIRVL